MKELGLRNLVSSTSRAEALKKVEELQKKFDDLVASADSILGGNWKLNKEDNDLFNTSYIRGLVKDQVKDALKNKYPNLTETQLDELTKIVIYQDKSRRYTDNEIISSSLSRLAFTNSNSVARRVFVPFKVQGSKVVPLVPQDKVDNYMKGVNALDNYFSNNPLPANLDLDNFDWHILDTSSNFAKFYKALGNRSSEKYIRERVLGFNSLNLGTGKSIIGLNPELQSKPGGESNFGTQDAFAETVIHEFGHSLHRSISILFGSSGPAGQDFNRDYKEIQKQFVSEYGKQNFEEHFSEAFSKYLSTGEATPEFKQFLQKYIHSRPAQARQPQQAQTQTESNSKEVSSTPDYDSATGLADIGEWGQHAIGEQSNRDRSENPGLKWDRYTAVVPVDIISRFAEFDRTKEEQAQSTSKETIDSIAKDLEEGGTEAIREPLWIKYDHKNKWGVLVEGNHRLAAALKAGVSDLPIVVTTGADLSSNKQKGVGAELNIDNRIVETGGYMPSDVHPGNFKQFEGYR